MRLSDLDYSLPSHLIAQNPAEPRENARLLVYTRATGEIIHASIRDLLDFLPPYTTVVVNNSRVRKSRCFTISGREVLILEERKECNTPETTFYEVLLRGKSPSDGEMLIFSPENIRAQVVRHHHGPGMTTVILCFFCPSSVLEKWLEESASVPLPPYITRSDAPDERYQTVYAGPLGSAAAPTAGLHFSTALRQSLLNAGHQWTEVTLHVGLGTFLPLRKEEITSNQLHSETTEISSSAAHSISSAVHHHKPVLSVGTTSVRAMESHWQHNTVRPGYSTTDMFIYPGYQFCVPNLLLTNFHLPKSSLLLLVSAFLGNTAERTLSRKTDDAVIKELLNLYSIAIKSEYRFFSFGDAMLIK